MGHQLAHPIVVASLWSIMLGGSGVPRGSVGEVPFVVRQYDITVEVVPATSEIRAAASVEIEATAAKVESAVFSLNRELEVQSLTSGGKKLKFSEGSQVAEGRELRVAIDPPLLNGKRQTLVFSYVGKGQNPGADGADWMGILLVRGDEIRMSHQSQWYPVVPRDERALAKLKGPVKLSLTLPSGMESLGPGEWKGKSSAAAGKEQHRWESRKPLQASVLAGKYKAEVIKEQDLTVRVLAFAEHGSGAKLWAKEALKALSFYRDRFGKLDRGAYGVAEMHVMNPKRSYNYEADGFSVYDSVLFDGREPDARKIAHEVAHLWWGGEVDPTGNGERFLTESLAEMSALLYVEKVHGAARAEDVATKWRERYASSSSDETSIARTTFGSPRYAEVIYARGPMALRTLRDRAGKSFDEALRIYVRKHGGKAPQLEDFLGALEEAGIKDVDAWADEWLLEPPGAQRKKSG